MNLKETLSTKKFELLEAKKKAHKEKVIAFLDNHFANIQNSPEAIEKGKTEIAFDDFNADCEIASAYLFKLGFPKVEYGTKTMIVKW